MFDIRRHLKRRIECKNRPKLDKIYASVRYLRRSARTYPFSRDSLTLFGPLVDLCGEERREGDEGDAEDDDEGGHHAHHQRGPPHGRLRLLAVAETLGVAARTERGEAILGRQSVCVESTSNIKNSLTIAAMFPNWRIIQLLQRPVR